MSVNTKLESYSLIIQSAFEPAFWGRMNGDEVVSFNKIDKDFFKQLKDININKVKDIFFNVGPGSYTGIRQAIAYVLGLMQSKRFRLFKFNTFDILDFLSYKDNFEYDFLVLKTWPRLRMVDFNQLRGFVKGKDGNIVDHLVEFDSFKNNKKYAVLFDKKFLDLRAPSNVKIYNFELDDIYDFFKFIKSKSKAVKIDAIDDIQPVYINPVHITSPKHKTS